MAILLIVDPDPTITDALACCLGNPSTIIPAAKASMALAIVERHPIDLVVLEYRLPDCSGLELLDQLKSLRSRLPAIMVTAFGSEWVCAAALKRGVRDYFIKPCSPEALVASINSILAAAQSQTEPRVNAIAAQQNRPGGRAPQEPRCDKHALGVERAVRFINEHYSDSVSLRTVAMEASTNPYTLSRTFGAIMGASFRSYLLRVRIAKAEQLLRDSGRTITEIAQMVGFGDLPRFDKVFRRATGMPPSVYRDRLRDKQATAH